MKKHQKPIMSARYNGIEKNVITIIITWNLIIKNLKKNKKGGIVNG